MNKHRGAVNHDMQAFGGGVQLPSDPLLDSQRPNARANFNIFHLFGADDPFISGIDPNSPLKKEAREGAYEWLDEAGYIKEPAQNGGGSGGGGGQAAQWIPGISNTVVIIGGAAAFLLLREGK